MQLAITGANGFIGRNLAVRLREAGHEHVALIGRDTTQDEASEALLSSDVIFHLAGVNRPPDPSEFVRGNSEATEAMCDTLRRRASPPHVVYASSTQAALDNAYGVSKRLAEEALISYGRETGAAVSIFRLTNVFGKWSRPNYNSAVATFCHNVAHGLPITIHDRAAQLRLVYVDDVLSAFLALLGDPKASGFVVAEPVYETTVGEVADIIGSFAASRASLVTPPVGNGLLRALHATYLSFLDPAEFSYRVPVHADPRGEFVEMLKTNDSGQFSYFTALPGITRGEHYHHTKTEKFLVIRGTARFQFRNIDSGATYEMTTRGGDAQIVETAPGWAHNITNVGDDELIVMLWANEIFDRAKPDTIASKVAS